MVPMVVDPKWAQPFEHGETFHDRQKSHRDGVPPYPQKKAGKGV